MTYIGEKFALHTIQFLQLVINSLQFSVQSFEFYRPLANLGLQAEVQFFNFMVGLHAIKRDRHLVRHSLH